MQYKIGQKFFITSLVLALSIFPQAASYASEVYSGSGDQIVDIKLTKKSSIVTFTHQGTSNFSVWALDENAESIDLLVNEIGSYSGTHLLDLSGNTLKYLEITADGTWTAEFKSLKSARKWTKKVIESNGDDVIQLSKLLPSSTKLKLNYMGNSNFAVWTFDKNGNSLDLKVNVIGNYAGTKFLGRSVKYIQIEAREGTWNLQR